MKACAVVLLTLAGCKAGYVRAPVVESPLRGIQTAGLYDGTGSSVPVGAFRMQPFGPEIVAMVGRRARTTAVAINDFLAGAGEGQVPLGAANRVAS